MENSVSVSLSHSGMDEEARVAELVNLLGQKFDSLRCVAENNGLTDVQL